MIGNRLADLCQCAKAIKSKLKSLTQLPAERSIPAFACRLHYIRRLTVQGRK